MKPNESETNEFFKKIDKLVLEEIKRFAVVGKEPLDGMGILVAALSTQVIKASSEIAAIAGVSKEDYTKLLDDLFIKMKESAMESYDMFYKKFTNKEVRINDNQQNPRFN